MCADSNDHFCTASSLFSQANGIQTFAFYHLTRNDVMIHIIVAIRLPSFLNLRFEMGALLRLQLQMLINELLHNQGAAVHTDLKDLPFQIKFINSIIPKRVCQDRISFFVKVST